MTLPKLSDIKNWSVELEHTITSNWQKSPYTFNPKTKKPIYSIDTPPPYVNAPIHMGHAITYCYMDYFARYKRMKGFEVLFPLGLDRNGLPIETAAEKKFNVSPFKMKRDEFIALCEKILAESSSESIDSFARLGISFSSYKQGKAIGDVYTTDDPTYRTITQSTFIDLYRKGLIYEDTRINNWDTKLQTTVADSEIDYKDVPSSFNHITFTVKETGKPITIATTRPELIASCGMIIFPPDDKRYASLEGKTAITPLYGKEVPIQEHPLAQSDKGTGLVMMCSAGDITDIQFFRELNLKPIISINKEGTMNEHAGFLQGLKVKEARAKIIEELKKHSLLVKQEQITHRTPVAERSGAEIEFIEMPEFYLKQVEFKDDLKEIANKINFYPENAKLSLERWIDSVSIDWPISRRRFYATPIPLWKSGNKIALPPQGNYYQPWKEQPPKDSEVFENGKYTGKKVKDLKLSWIGEERVCDTWFDSSISELVLLQYSEDGSFFKKNFPASLRPQGKEIVRTWLYYTLLRGYLATDKPAFKDVWVHNHILDEKGRKMSKSLGNVINPQDIIKTEGTEALRLWSAIEGDLAKGDISCSRERIKAETKTINKLINIAKFVTQFKKPTKAKLTKTDATFLAHLEYLAAFADEHYNEYDFHYPAIKLREFLWDTYASHYIELVKNRAYNEQKTFSKPESESAHFALHEMLIMLSKLLYPIVPQITSIVLEHLDQEPDRFPEGNKDASSEKTIIQLKEFNSHVWKTKKDQGISLREPIKGIKIPAQLVPFEQDLRAAHNIQ